MIVFSNVVRGINKIVRLDGFCILYSDFKRWLLLFIEDLLYDIFICFVEFESFFFVGIFNLR